MEAFLWSLHTKEHQDVFMYPRNCMSTKVLVGNPLTQNIDAFLGDLDMQRLVSFSILHNDICLSDLVKFVDHIYDKKRW